MLKSYLLTTLRSLWKHKTFTAINLAGLSIGMAACLLILQYVNFELSYDQFNTQAANIYRVFNDRYQHGKLVQHGTITYSGVGKAMQDDFPEVAAHSRILPWGGRLLQVDDKKLVEKDVYFVDNSFIHMFTVPLVAGDRENPLREPYNLVLSETLARQLFGTVQCVGRFVKVDKDSVPFKVTAVCKDIPENAHLPFQMLVSYQSILSLGYKEADYDFTDSDFWHYIMLKPGTDYRAFEAKLPAFSQRHFQGAKISGSDEKFFLQPLSRAHLYSDFEYEIGKTGNGSVVWGLLIIALIIIVIAWVNYINLATARSIERAREVGIRKVVGAGKAQLVRQFLIESLLINGLSLFLAVCIVLLIQPFFNQLLGHSLSLASLVQKGLGGHAIPVGLGILIVTGILVSGFYPAFVLSSFKPMVVLKGKFSNSVGGVWLRRILVVGQFAITITLIIGSLVVFRQLRFMSNQQLGVNLNQVMVIKQPSLTSYDSTFISHIEAFKAEIRQIPHVVSVTTSWRVPGDELPRTFDARQMGGDPSVHFTFRYMGADADFIKTYGIRLLGGRSFSPIDYNPDFKKLHNIILNPLAIKLLGFASPEAALGRKIVFNEKEWDIIGVMDDFHQKSLRYAVEPMVLIPAYSTNSPFSLKVDPKDISQTVAALKARYNAFFPGNMFDYFFLDEHFNQQYKDDLLFGRVFGLFACLGIFVACLGLLGLSLFTVIQRTKEIGVRKVLGASESSIIVLLSGDFVRLVLVANVIAFPLAWVLMHRWLQSFAYKTVISWWLFALSGFLALLIAMGTVGWQAFRAARANPVKSLRSE
jgi:putative ABC transport system permease protein